MGNAIGGAKHKNEVFVFSKKFWRFALQTVFFYQT